MCREEKEEPFDFAQLPTDLQFKVVDKFYYEDFAVLDRTSRLGNAVCWGKLYSLLHEINYITVNKRSLKLMPITDYRWEFFPLVPWHVAAQPPTRFWAYCIYIQGMVNSGRMQAVAKLFERNETTTDIVEITGDITFKPADLDRLIKAVKPCQFCSFYFVPRQFFEIESMQSLNTIRLSSCGFTDHELLNLKCEYLFVKNDFVTAEGLNYFLKQWKKKERDFTEICIKFDTSVGSRDYATILDGLEANAIWTPAFAEYPEHFYALSRSAKNIDTRYLRLSNERFELTCHECEDTFLMYALR